MHRTRTSWELALSPFRRLLVLLALSVMSLCLPASAETAGDAAARTGTTPPAAAAHEELQGPRDAVRLGPGQLSPTSPPAGFNVFDGGWIRFYYHPSNRERVESLIAEATHVRRELSERLGVPVLSSVRVDVARTPGEMATLAPIEAPFPDYAAGVAYPDIGLVLLTLAPVHVNDHHDLVQVFRHELAHIALHEAVSTAHVPRWFNEGFAVLASGESSFTRLQTLWTATLADSLLPLDRMERGFPRDEASASIAYAQAVDLVRFLVRDQEQHRFHRLIEQLRAGDDFRTSLTSAYAVDLTELEREWREDLAKRYTFWPVLFSGTFVWMGALGLFVLGWRKRKLRARRTLAQWAQQEAQEDELRRRFLQAQAAGRVHIVLSRTAQAAASPMPPPPPSETEVPRVQHDGQWHTLH